MGGILFLEDFLQPLANFVTGHLSVFGLAELDHFVAAAPDDDGRMVSVASDHVAGIDFGPFIENGVIAVGGLITCPNFAFFAVRHFYSWPQILFFEILLGFL